MCMLGGLLAAPVARAQTATAAQQPPAALPGFQGLLGVAPDDWSIFTQATYVDQWHYGFPAAYSGPDSLQNTAEVEHTFSYSLFLDRRVWQGGELIYNPEIFQGHGLSQTLGVAGFPNGEAVKSGYANLHYNTSRLFLRQVVGLGGAKEKLERDVNQVDEEVDVNRLTLSIGKFSGGDFFDGNAYSHDPRTQFMNWAMWESAAWDYPADVVGFTSGGVLEWNTENTTLHYGIFLEPDVPNSARMDFHVLKAHGQILQFDYRYKWGDRSGTLRPFAYWNQARMGSFNLATEAAEGTGTPAETAPTRAYRSKVGFGVSWDQEVAANLGAFARLSWDDGRTETWAFTQIDRSVAAGLSLKGGVWKRADDTVGLAVAVDGLSPEQRDYLEAGGTGLIIGDGALNYRTEQILETYYAFQALKWLQITFDYQYIRNPAYNAARGPVPFYAVRAHVQF
jgi:high affinity Mn2+ porin